MQTLATTKKNGGAHAAPANPLIDDFFGNIAAMRRAMMRSFFDPITLPEMALDTMPAVNLYEKDGTYTLECAVPGYRKEDIKVDASGDVVTIGGSYERENSDEKAHYHRREVRRGSFTRSIALPQEIDPDKVTAKITDGMLTVTLRPSKAVRSKAIPVTAG